MSRYKTPVQIGFRLKNLPVHPWYLCTTRMWASWSETLCPPCIALLGALQLSMWVFVFFCRLSLLLVQDLSTTAHSVLQVTRLDDVPLTGMSSPVAHLVLLLFFRYIPWWYWRYFDTANHPTCHGANVIYLVYWIAVTFFVGEVRVSSLRHDCANVPCYLLLHSNQELMEANILLIPLMRQQTGNMWASL